MAQLIWGCSLRQRNEVHAVSYHGKMPRTGDSSYYNFTQPTGFLEPISMTQAGYTTKKEFGEFLRSFGVLAPEILSENNGERFACLKLLDKLGLTNYQLGETKVFLRASHMAELVAQKTKVLERAARTIQRPVHASMLRKEFLLLRQAAIETSDIHLPPLIRDKYGCKLSSIEERNNIALIFNSA